MSEIPSNQNPSEFAALARRYADVVDKLTRLQGNCVSIANRLRYMAADTIEYVVKDRPSYGKTADGAKLAELASDLYDMAGTAITRVN